MSRKKANKEVPIRTKVMKEFGVDIPETAKLIFDWALRGDRKKPMLSFGVSSLPPSVNHMYEMRGRRRYLTQEALDFRQLVQIAIGAGRFGWKPAGAVMSLIFLESPHWITKKHTIRDMDGDNRVKPLFDAIQITTGVKDYTNWEFHCYKLASSKIRTSVYLFDVGDLVEWYP